MKPHQAILLEQLRLRQSKNPSFSLRAFARVLDTSPSHLSSLISGRKKLTPKMVAKLIDKLDLQDSENEMLVEGLLSKKSKKTEVPLDLKIMQDDEFSLISEWYHYAILSLSKLDNKADARWIAAQLGIDPMLALQAFHRLRRLGLVVVKDGKFRRATKHLDTTTDIPSKAIRSYHRQNLELASEKIETVPVERREYSTITMSVDASQLPLAKKMINDFKHKFSKQLGDPKKASDVYTLAIQFFPVTKMRNQP